MMSAGRTGSDIPFIRQKYADRVEFDVRDMDTPYGDPPRDAMVRAALWMDSNLCRLSRVARSSKLDGSAMSGRE